jgi:hypothetical protein
MKLEKTRENISRKYVDGESVDSITEVIFKILNDEGSSIGEARAYQSSFNLSINGQASNLEDAEQQLKSTLNITED